MCARVALLPVNPSFLRVNAVAARISLLQECEWSIESDCMHETRSVAVIGASSDRRKFGNKAVRAFAASGWRVFPVNPKEEVVEGLKAYPDLAAVPGLLDAITLYLPPPVVLKLLPAIAERGAREVWFNPGTADEAVSAEASRLKIAASHGCSIVAIGRSPAEFPDA
jgi:hypothetical protein